MKEILQQLSINYTGNLQKNNLAILLSGGMDSIALAYWKKPAHSITIDYGQKAANAEMKLMNPNAKPIKVDKYKI